MTKRDFDKKVNEARTATHDALAEVWNSLNHGQQQKLLKNAKVAELLKRYGVVD